MSEKAKVPVDFLPHHANLSREHRTDLEKSLKTRRTTTAICTSTLELGIDIGDIDCVAQIGPPFSVASLRQRLGRSGRRPGQPAVLRMYAIEREAQADSHPLERLHLGLVRSVAMVELLREMWCEPPAPQELHLSTLCHQVLSVIAERGGVNAGPLYDVLCGTGPFKMVSPAMFARLLRDLGSGETALIEQAPDGTLLLGPQGEKLVEHYSFYAVFQRAEEFRVVARDRQIGSLPATNVFVPDMTIIFSGKRWRITQVHSKDRVIEVSEDRTGRPPPFGGTGGQVHDRIIETMRVVLAEKEIPAYLDGDSHGVRTVGRAPLDTAVRLRGAHRRQAGRRRGGGRAQQPSPQLPQGGQGAARPRAIRVVPHHREHGIPAPRGRGLRPARLRGEDPRVLDGLGGGRDGLLPSARPTTPCSRS